jgi:hypothetical protein
MTGDLRFVQMQPELFSELRYRSESGDFDIETSPQAQRVVCSAPNVALALMEDCDLVAAAGVYRVWPGRGIAWFSPGRAMSIRHFALARARCRIELDKLAKAGMFRIECTCLAGEPELARFAWGLGFVREGRMVAYGRDARDYHLFARIDWDTANAVRLKAAS